MVKRNTFGFSLLELLVVLAVLGILAGIAGLNLRPLETPAQSGANALGAAFRQARAKAMGSTSAYRVRAADGTAVVETAGTCGGDESDWLPAASPRVELPAGVSLSGGWNVCFDSRGYANANATVTATDRDGRTDRVEVMLGGAVRRPTS